MKETLLISRNDVKKRLNMKKTIEIVEQVFKAHGTNQVNMPSKITLDLGESNDWPPYGGSFNAMPAYIGGSVDIAGIKWVWGFNDNPKKNLPYINGTILLNDPTTGEQLAVMDGSYITDLRTGAVTGVAVKYLAKSDSKIVGLVGAGAQARENLSAIKEVVDIKTAKVFDLNKEAAQRFAQEMSKTLGIDIHVMDTNEEIAKNSDIVVTVTTANQPLIKKEWLKEGALVVSVGSFQELDDDIPLLSDKLIVDSWKQNEHRGELVHLVQAGKLNENKVDAELQEVVIGKNLGRSNDKEIICACLIGMGSIDIGIASTIYKEIKESASIRSFNLSE